MLRPQAYVCCALLALSACDPVLLFEESMPHHGGSAPLSVVDAAVSTNEPELRALDAGRAQTNAAGSAPVAALPDVILSLAASECGSCFDVSASVRGGRPPYRYEWEDGSSAESRHVCVGSNGVAVAVVVEDANRARSSVRVMHLEADVDSLEACASRTLLCLKNPSFEGTPALNTGGVFDAAPWSDCVDSATDPLSNTPEIASNTLDPATGIAPVPVDGLTYLALSAGEQASETLCEALSAQDKTSMQLDAMQLGLGGPDVYLQIWGGTSSTCAQEQLLWTSPQLSTSWMRYCVPLAPKAPMDQITLRAEIPTSTTSLPTSYLAVDHLVPVSECP